MRSTDLKNRLLRLAAGIGATEMAVFAIEENVNGVLLVPLLHERAGDDDAKRRNNALQAFEEIIAPLLEERTDAIVNVGTADASGRPQYCLVVFAREGNEAVGVATLIVRRVNDCDARLALAALQLEQGA